MFKRKSTVGNLQGQDAPRKESITATGIRTQAAGGPPVQQTVKVAVVPPRLPPGMAPPTGLGPADAFSWDESVNWQHNELLVKGEQKKNFLQKAGLTAHRDKANNMPNFTFREVPYDIWRKHYAKDKDGNYKGTEAPAEDCILNPTDVAKWRLEEPKTKADLYTRGSAVLPVYKDADTDSNVPAYTEKPEEAVDHTRLSAERPATQQRASSFTADGRTTEEIIKDAEDKAKVPKPKKEQFRDAMRSGVNMMLLGS